MKPSLFTYKFKPGKLQSYLDFMKRCTEGDLQQEYKDLLLRYGLNSVTMWHHNIDGDDYAMFIHKMDDDGAEKLATWNQHGHPFDEQFNSVLADSYVGFTVEQPQFVVDFNAKS